MTTYIWTGAQSSNWAISFNWSPGGFPSGSGDTAEFHLSSVTSVSLTSASFGIGGITFDSGAPSYTITIDVSGGGMALNGAGIADNSGVAQNFVVAAQELQFQNSATAGDAVITVNSGAFLQFFQTSSGGTAEVIVNSGGVLAEQTSSGALSIGALAGAGAVLFATQGGGAATQNLTVGSRNTDTAFSGVIEDSTAAGSLTKVGTGALTLSGDNTYSLGTTIDEGALQLGSGGASGSVTGGIVDNATLAIDRSDTVTFANAVSGTGAFRQIGSGVTIFTTAESYSGVTTIGAGTLQLGNGGTSGSVAGSVTDNATLTIDRSDTFAFGNAISGTGALRQIGSGATILTAGDAYTGGTTITAGALQLGVGGSLAATGALTITGGVFDLNGHSQTVGDLSGAGGEVALGGGVLVAGTTNDETFAGAISGSGAFIKAGSGRLTLTGANTYHGGTTIAAGTLQIGAGGASGLISGDVFDNGALALDRSDSVAFAGTISGAGGFSQLGAGTVALSGANSYTGGTTVAAGALSISADDNLGTGGTLALEAGAMLDLTDSFTLAHAMTIAGDSTVEVDAGLAAAINSTIADGAAAGVLVKAGAGALTLAGANAYSGGTIVSGGTLTLDHVDGGGNFDAAGSGAVTLHGGGLRTAISGGILASFDIKAGATSTIAAAAATTLFINGDSVAIAGDLVFGSAADTGTIVFEPTHDTVASVTIEIAGGTLKDGNGAVGDLTFNAGATRIDAGATLDLNDFSDTIANLRGSAATAVLEIGNEGATDVVVDAGDFAGQILGAGSLTKASVGTLTLSGDVNIAGALRLTGGATRVASGATLTVGRWSVSGSGTMATIAESLAYGGRFSQGAGSTLRVSSGDRLALQGVSTFAGTIVGAGIFSVAGGSATLKTGASLSVAKWWIQGAGARVTINETLTYGGVFSQAAGTTLSLAGGWLALTGTAHFAAGTVAGSEKLYAQGTTTISGLALGGTVELVNSKSMTQGGGGLIIGDASSAAASLWNRAGATYAIVANSGIGRGSSAASAITNAGLFEKTGGTGTSAITPNFVNNGAVEVAAGAIDFEGAISGRGALQIDSGKRLEADAAVSSGQTVLFEGDDTLMLADAAHFAATLSGFDATDRLDLTQFGSVTRLSFAENSGGTGGTLTVADGALAAHIHLLGGYSSAGFHAASDRHGGSVITYSG